MIAVDESCSFYESPLSRLSTRWGIDANPMIPVHENQNYGRETDMRLLIDRRVELNQKKVRDLKHLRHQGQIRPSLRLLRYFCRSAIQVGERFLV